MNTFNGSNTTQTETQEKLNQMLYLQNIFEILEPIQSTLNLYVSLPLAILNITGHTCVINNTIFNNDCFKHNNCCDVTNIEEKVKCSYK